MVDVAGGAQQDRLVGGSQLISIRMAEQLEMTREDLGELRSGMLPDQAVWKFRRDDQRILDAQRLITRSESRWPPALLAARPQPSARLPVDARALRRDPVRKEPAETGSGS